MAGTNLHVLQVYADTNQKQLIEVAAESENQSVSNFALMCMLRKAAELEIVLDEKGEIRKPNLKLVKHRFDTGSDTK